MPALSSAWDFIVRGGGNGPAGTEQAEPSKPPARYGAVWWRASRAACLAKRWSSLKLMVFQFNGVGRARSKHHRGTTMNYYAGIDVSLEYSSVCVMDGSGKIVREAKVLSEPDALIAWFGELGFGLERIGLEAGPLSQWLFAAMKGGLEVKP